jgi:ribonucleoside-diphosphate reductase beta chain
MTEVLRKFDPLLEVADGQREQYCLFPVQHQDIFQFYKKAVSAFWTSEELDFKSDRQDYDSLTPAEQTFIKHVLGFFAASDAMVNQNLSTNFSDEVVIQEAKCFYAFQQAMESIHSEVYSLLIDTIITNKQEKDDLFNALETLPVISQKAAYMQKYMTRNCSFEERLVAFSCVEGVLFSSSFCAIYFFKKRNLMPALILSNQFISRDEAMHTEFAVLLYSKLQNKLPEQKVQQIVRDAVEVESAFVKSALEQDLLGMNADSMIMYVQYIADRLLLELGCSKVYNVRNPFQWMDAINLQGLTSMFELKNDSYAKAGMAENKEEEVFSLEVEF